jgi:mono/diheme cytochrome c family protein
LRLSLAVALILLPLSKARSAPVDFRRDIEPIFVKRCSECHGPEMQKGKLRLDKKELALKGGKSGQPLLIAGKSGESELIARVTASDPDDVMPAKGERLTAEQIAVLKRWIDEGAVWPDQDPRSHWSFVKPVRPPLPAVQHPDWVRNEIDRFILARLEKEGLMPSPEADRTILIRRVTLDLTGLPPTPAEVDNFTRDSRSDAYEQLVNRLLQSPHYGEHVARWWLDLARYADSNGYQVDLARSIWPYRDWVIDAFNANMPFDQFTVEQLAGDLLPNATLSQKIATGFNRNTKINDEGGGDAEEYRTKAVKDRVATTATTWLGLTMMCAECHTHKYDPITQDEYYRFYGFFNNTADGGNYSVEPTLPVPPPPTQSEIESLHRQIADIKKQIARAEQDLPRQQQAWEERMGNKTNVWRVLDLTNAISTGGATLTNLPDHSLLSTALNPIYDTITVEAMTDVTGITAVLLEALPDPSLPKNGPGRWKEGNFILDEFAIGAAPAAQAEAKPAGVALARATADWEQEYYRAEHAIDRNPKTGWAIGPQVGKRHFLIAETKEPTGYAEGTKLAFRFDHYHGNSHTIGRMRISVSSETDKDALWPVTDEVAALLRIPMAERSPAQRTELAAYYRTVSPTVRRLERELFRLNQREMELASAKYSTLIMQERSETPRTNYVHVRGNFLERGKLVEPGVPAFLHPFPANEPTNRLTLARWLMSPDNPLTARVTVNRLWERVFGTGIVKTSEDLGRQGEAPSHPELLDWLATEFIRSGWDMKAMQKMLVCSATYRQSSSADEQLLEKDLYNRLLARGPRFRLDAETIRDQALAVSGLLNPQVGGPSVYPVQPANLWKEIGFLRPEIGMDEWPTSEGPDLYRRGVYTFWRRVCTYPTFSTFDAPSRETCISRRPRTNTPLQALAGLNEPTFLEAARALAQRVLMEGGSTTSQQIEFAFRLCEGRGASAGEKQRLLSLYTLQLDSFKKDPSAAEALLKVGSVARPERFDPAELAAWMMVANVLLNLDETLTKS